MLTKLANRLIWDVC